MAYRGTGHASTILLEALRKLEYRGYDSAGIATLVQHNIAVRKGVGKVATVDAHVHFSELQGNTGIAHTRWATTGAVTDVNAHPHVAHGFAIVQNGIVENYQELKAELISKGYTFESETDTEVILKLIIEEAKRHNTLQAVQRAFLRLHGRNTFVLLEAKTGNIYAAKMGSPLIIGVAKDALFLASDSAPLLEHTREVIFIEDSELVELSTTYACYDSKSLERIEKPISHIEWTIEQAQKGTYAHYMLKEIMEQKHTITDALVQDPALVARVAKNINEAFGTYIVGCGTAGKVALTATYAFSRIAKKHVNFAVGSEFPSLHDFLTDRSLLIAISQSGETADTLEAIDTVRQKHGSVVSVVNVMGSTIMRKSDATLLVNAGPEKSVCSTKATTGQLALMFLLAYACDNRYEEGLRVLKSSAHAVDNMLTETFCHQIKEIAQHIAHRNDMYVLGRGLNYPVALEAAIKIQEVSYIHAEGFAGGELKHGPLALVSAGTPCIVFVANDETREDIISNALEVKLRGGFIIGVAPHNNAAFDVWIKVPDLPETSPIVNIIAVQLLAYELAVLHGNDVDMPRNLAKSVTVK